MKRQESAGLDTLFEEWGADAAPEGFSSRVALLAQGECEPTRSMGARRPVVVPLLLVALFVSAGAAAAWDGWRPARTSLRAETSSSDVTPRERSFELTFHMVQDQGRAVPEMNVAESPQASEAKVRQPPPSSALPPEAEEDATQGPLRVVHWPQCECGTSGVVCTCSD